MLQSKASCNAETLDLLNDTYRFLFSHHQTISESAMHTYYSALPFTPHNTRLYPLYEQETRHSITVLRSISPTWTSCLSTLSFFEGRGCILSISPNGMWLAAGQDRTIVILDARTTASQCQISLTDKIVCLAFSPSESTLATVTSESLELWNTTTGINQKTQILRARVHEVAFSSQGQYLLLSSHRGLHLHHGTDAGELSVLSTHWSHTKIIFASDDKQVITGSKEGYIHFFMLSGNQLSEIQERRISNETEVSGLVLRHDGKRLASSGVDGMIRIYDLPYRSPIATLRLPQTKSFTIRYMAYHPTEEELAVGHRRCVVLWRQISPIRIGDDSPSQVVDCGVTSESTISRLGGIEVGLDELPELAMSPDGVIFEMKSGWMPSIHSNHRWYISGIAYCQNGTQMYTTSLYGDIKLWTTMVTQVQGPPKHIRNVNCYAVNQPTSLLATGSYDTSIILWHFTVGYHWKTLLSHTPGINSLRFSEDGVLLASGCFNNTTMVWDITSGTLLHKLGPHFSCSSVLTFSEDNAHLTTSDDINKECFVWELKSGKQLERRDLDILVDIAHTAPYCLTDIGGWQTVVSASQRKKCKYGFCRPPGEYRSIRPGPIFGDRAALFCEDGRVLILDISRVMNVHMDPTRQVEF